jgi:hypothetical protein
MRKSLSFAVVGVPIAVLAIAGCRSSAMKNGDTPPSASNATTSSVASGSTVPAGDNSRIDTKNLTAKIFAAVNAADSFRVVGAGKDNGTAYALDIHFGAQGASGHFSEGGQRFDLSGKAGAVYMKASAETWKATIGDKPNADTAAAKLADHWVKVPSTGSNFAQLGAYVDKDNFVASFAEGSTTSGPFTKAGTASVSGTDAVEFVDQSDQSKVYIAAHGAPLLLKVEAPDSQGGGGLTFSDYNQPFSPTVPAPGEVIDLTTVLK